VLLRGLDGEPAGGGVQEAEARLLGHSIDFLAGVLADFESAGNSPIFAFEKSSIVTQSGCAGM
jgi:hypothetical protein